MTCKFVSDFSLRERVYIDGDETLKATITGVMFVDAQGTHECQCSYILNGVPQQPWIESWRLTHCS